MLIAIASIFILLSLVFYGAMFLRCKSMGAGSTKDRMVFSLLESCTWVLLLQAPAILILDATFSEKYPFSDDRLFSMRTFGMVLESVVLLWLAFFVSAHVRWSKAFLLLHCFGFGLLATWLSQRYFHFSNVNEIAQGNLAFELKAPWVFYFLTILIGWSFLMTTMPLKHGVNLLGTPPARLLWHRHFRGAERFAFSGLVVFTAALAWLSLVFNIAWVPFQHYPGGVDQIMKAFQGGATTQTGDIVAQHAQEMAWLFYFLFFAIVVAVVSFLLDFFQRLLRQAELQTALAQKNEERAWQIKKDSDLRLCRALSSKGKGIVSWAAQGLDANMNMEALANTAGKMYFELSSLHLLKTPDVETRSLRAFFAAWVLEEEFAQVEESLNTFFSNREETLQLEFRAILKDNSAAMFTFTGKLIRDVENGAPLFLDGFINNITDEARALEDLRNASDSRMQTIYAVSHDLGSPLGLIQMSSGFLTALMKREGVFTVPAQKFLERIDDCVKESRLYLGNALSMAKTGDPNFKFELTEVKVYSLISKIVETQAAVCRFDLDRVHLEIEQDSCIEAIQEYFLQMILSNLISNAFKYTHHADAQVVIRVYSKIQVSAGLESSRCIIEVQDNGIGISDSLKLVLFKPFSRGDNVDDVKGTGLGLTVVKRAADLLDAQIDLLETRQGTCFRLTLPHALAKYVSDPVSN
jgi:signal transduction histidine kinase